MAQEDNLDPKNVDISDTSQAPVEHLEEELEQPIDDESRELVDQVRRFFEQWARSMKNMSIYRHNTGQYDVYLAPSFECLSDLLEDKGALAWKVESLGFRFLGEMVFEQEANELNLANKFYRTGIRILTFRQGVTADEFKAFSEICLTNFQSAEFLHEDMVSMMWKAEFTNIEYVVVETMAVGTEGDDDAKVELDKIVNFLYRRLSSTSDDSSHFARLSLEDLEIELDDVEQAKGVRISGVTATDEDKQKIQFQLAEEDENRLMPKLIVILFKVLEEELDEDLTESLRDVFIQLLDNFILHEDFSGINQILKKFKGIKRKRLPEGNLERISRIEENFLARMGDAERLERIGEVLDSTSRAHNTKDVYQYLIRLDANAILPLLQVLENLEKPEPRRVFCDALLVLGKEHLETFVLRLQSPKPNLVRDMVYIVNKLNPPNRLDLLATLLVHPNLAIRVETLKTIGSGSEPACIKYVIQALNDEDTQMRISAAQLLPNFDMQDAVRILLEIVNASEFQLRPDKERETVYATLALTNAEEAMNFFSEQLKTTSLISKKKLAAHKQLIVRGLAKSGSIGAYNFLKAEVEAGFEDEELGGLAKRICERMRKRLLGA